MLPTVGIGLPTYRRPERLRRTLKSVQAQTYPALDIFVADDASPDNTPDVVAEAQAKDARIRYHRHAANIGAVRNFAYVLDQCTSPYFMWMSDDDLLAPRFVERLMAELERDPGVDLAFCDYDFIDEDYHSFETWDLSFLHPDRPWSQAQLDFWQYPYSKSPNVMSGIYRTDALRRVKNPFTNTFKRLVSGHEAPLLAQIAMRGRIVAVPEVLFSRMQHSRDKDSLAHTVSRNLSKIDLALLYGTISAKLAWYAVRARAPIRQRLRLLKTVAAANLKKVRSLVSANR